MGFDPTWLNARARFDALARDPTLLPALYQGLGEPDSVVLVDAGAGLGAGARFCIPHIPAAQLWWLLDRDPELLSHSLPATARWAEDQGWTAHLEPDRLTIEGAPHPIELRTLRGDLSALDQRVDLDTVDAVTANALFDLLSVEAFGQFARLLASHRTALYASLNYASMRFVPPRQGDAAMIALYEAHMSRPRPGGPSMGARCGPEMRAELSAAGMRTLAGRSVWALPPEAHTMLDLMLGFMAGSLPEMAGSEDQKGEVAAWLSKRRADLDVGAVGMVVEHEDLMALPV